jgi:hypothetical protein
MVRITTVPKMLSASDAFGEETSRRYPFVMVMKSTDFRQLPHRPILVTVSFTYMRNEADCILRTSQLLRSFSS